MAASTISAGGPVPAADLGVAAVVAFNPAGLDLLDMLASMHLPS
jgi:hypothetical protein